MRWGAVIERTTRLKERFPTDELFRIVQSVSRRRLKRVLFGDDLGLLLFLGWLLWFTVPGRTDVLVNDTFVLLDTLLSVVSGDVHLTRLVYIPDPNRFPGVFWVDRQLVGRNYGQVIAAVPIYLALRGLSLLFELRALIVGVWSGCLYYTLVIVHRHTQIGNRWSVAVVAVAACTANLAVSRPIPDTAVSYLAGQLLTMLAAAATGVVAYRLLRARVGREGAATAAALTVAATPVGFFATVPKRHTFSVALLLVAMYGLYRS